MRQAVVVHEQLKLLAYNMGLARVDVSRRDRSRPLTVQHSDRSAWCSDQRLERQDGILKMFRDLSTIS